VLSPSPLDSNSSCEFIGPDFVIIGGPVAAFRLHILSHRNAQPAPRTIGSQKPGRRVKQDRVHGLGLAEPIPQNHAHLVIARSGRESDDTPLFQVSQNALTGTIDDELDIRLGRLGRGME